MTTPYRPTGPGRAATSQRPRGPRTTRLELLEPCTVNGRHHMAGDVVHVDAEDAERLTSNGWAKSASEGA